ncbi:MAG TPA: alpha/beta hydrolase-fold protein [Rhodothermales bacterium]|nr:alpha/beta hydrolase-fold protein [Rhodothermales bacterium]
MQRNYVRWHSPHLGRDMEMLTFGHAGTPVVVFPSSMGRFYEWEDFKMIDALSEKIDAGYNRVFCLDSVDAESFYNKAVDPFTRIRRHQQYEAYVMREVLPHVQHTSGNGYVIATGASFGGYHAANLYFKYPGSFGKLISLSGAYDLTSFLDGFYNDDVYFSSPAHFVRNLNDPGVLHTLRQGQVVLTTGEFDPCRDANEDLAGVLRAKDIPVTLDFAPGEFAHDWPWWRAQIAQHIV